MFPDPGPLTGIVYWTPSLPYQRVETIGFWTKDPETFIFSEEKVFLLLVLNSLRMLWLK